MEPLYSILVDSTIHSVRHGVIVFLSASGGFLKFFFCCFSAETVIDVSLVVGND